jgi:hypothetical protein
MIENVSIELNLKNKNYEKFNLFTFNDYIISFVQF